jgi:acyl-CoA oxidase
LSAAKYWPGELSILANYAMVFAQAIVNGKSKGVYPFLVQIKDANYDWMPGIRGGDIGPKLGFHAKENGYMFLNNVRVPKTGLFNKYVQVSDNGEFTINGDPRVSYGTMMHIREIISCDLPKAYSVPIIIASRYSLFRRQFRNGKKEEVTIMDYQTQQDKVLPRIAEYFALSVGGNKIRAGSEQNSANILKNDFSLLQ